MRVKPKSMGRLFVLMCAFAGTQQLSAQTSDFYGHDNGWTHGGHIKYQYIYTRIPDYSMYYRFGGDNLQDHNLEGRLKLSTQRNRWDFRSDIQFINVHSDTLAGTRNLPELFYPGGGVINDDRRYFDLTHAFKDRNKDASIIRLDRISVGFTGKKTVLRFGRQALSWGSGLMFTPMDIMNPFDPTAVDKEYKTGDDMIYGQYLLDNGSDLQLAAVVRREPVSGEISRDVSSLALKYHGFWGQTEYDLLISEHYGQNVIGVGFSTDMLGVIWRADLVWNDTEYGSIYTGVAGVTFSGITAEHNWTGILEYYYSGFGEPGGVYTPLGILANRELVKRLARGELFNVGRHYLGASVTLELTPLLNITPNIFVNVIDPSAYTQVVVTYDFKQDFRILGALNVPIGEKGSEYGGIRGLQTDQYLSTGVSAFVELAWYF